MEAASLLFERMFWNENKVWTDEYFVCTVGNMREKMLKDNIKNLKLFMKL